MKITREFIEKHKSSRGGWNFSQLSALGVEWPPVKGWLKRIIGEEITDEQAKLFIEYGVNRPIGKKRKEIRAKAKKKIVRRPVFTNNKSRIDPNTDAFLQSYEWRVVRMEALVKYGNRCQCCGATPSDGIRINVDHIKPRKFFPHLALVLDNLQILCDECNHGKSNWDSTDWRDSDSLEQDQVSHLRSIK